MSFPYKIRKVAWGSCKPNNKSDTTSTTTNNFDPTLHLGGDINDPHTIGGNLQHAILLDLIELRHRYYTDLASSSTTNNKNTNHTTTGMSFGQFKKCFREARFGAIHTRTIPARVDRGEYVQLLYSSCFYLLEQAFGTHNNRSQVEEVGNDSTTNYTLNWNDDEHNTNSAFNAIYAIFILYTLHKTNILPKPPPTSTSESNKYNNEQSLQNSWSMLPLGNNNDEDKLYRRTFHGKIRIDRYNYMLLLQLREICLVRIEQCDISSKKMEFSNSSTSAESDTTNTWQCNCSLARDAVYILDIMLSSNDDDNDDFFEYCEYHGPHSLEGLSGSPNFYRSYFSNNQKSTQSSNLVDSTTSATAPSVCNESELNEMINTNNNEDTLDMQSLSQLVKGHQTNLSTVMSQLYKSRHTKDDELQPKQRELVENTLKDINIPNEPLQFLANDKSATNDTKSPESPTIQAETKQETTTKQISFLQFPETFSTTLCNEIRSSLEVDFRNDIDMIRKDVIMNKRRDEVRMNQQVVIDYGDDFTSIASFEQVKKRPSDIANDDDEAPSLGRKRQRRGVDDELDLEEEDDLERDDELSIATGGGRNALYSLLSMVGGNGGGCGSDVSNYDEDESIATAEADHIDDKSVPPSNGKSHIQPMASIDDDDDASVVSGMGTRALQFLLSSHQSTKRQSKKQAQVQKKRTKSSRKAPPKEDKNEDDNESEGISEAAGTNALATLLAHI